MTDKVNSIATVFDLNDSKAENRGQPVLVHPGSSLLSVLAVTREDSNPSLLPKQVEGLGPGCLKTGCPLIAAMKSF